VTTANKKAVEISLGAQNRSQHTEPDVWLCFAPIKKDRTDFIIEKATELGVSHMQPVFTERTQTTRVNVDRLKANAREAAEQSERLTVPDLAEPVTLLELLEIWPSDRILIHMDETGTGAPLAQIMMQQSDQIGFLIGPAGGFTPEEVSMIGKHPMSVAADLGPRILRAETACVAALGVRQAIDDLPPQSP
jgi:16S rRNA (uracil1498-N3)-methyltransferase